MTVDDAYNYGQAQISYTNPPMTSGSGGGSRDSNITDSTGTTGGNAGADASPNILHDYVNYTYRSSLWLMDKNSMDIGSGQFLFADSGEGSESRHSAFPVDLTIDNIQLKSIVGIHSGTQGTDVLNLKFDIIEPYAANLFAYFDMLDAEGVGWNKLFFALKLEWLGYTQDGSPTKITSKIIPFQFTQIKMNVKSGCSIYSASGVPYHQAAFLPTTNSVDIQLELQGNTVEELVNGGGGDSSTGIKSLKDALNRANATLAEKAGVQPDTYDFVLNDGIGDNAVVNKEKIALNKLPKSNPTKEDYDKGRQGDITLKIDKNVFNFQTGTKITEVIKKIIENSDFMRAGGGAKYIKFDADVQFGDYINSKNDYQKNITYIVSEYPISGAEYVGEKISFTYSPANNIVKEYNYFFTGQNQDILNLDLDYKAAFFLPVNAGSAQYTDVEQDIMDAAAASDAGNGNSAGNLPVKDLGNQPSKPAFLRPKVYHVRGIANRQNSSGNTGEVELIDITNYVERIFDNHVDMLKINLTIVGDPDWIWNGKASDGIDLSKETHYKLTFNSPMSDYNASGGFGSAGSAEFTGSYKILSVMSELKQGKFTQVLESIKI